MKIFKKTLNALRRINISACVTALAVTLISLIASGVHAAPYNPPKILASVTIPSESSAWNALERLADEMKFAEVVKGARELLNANSPYLAALDSDSPIGFVVATDGDAVFFFGYFPLANTESLDEEAINSLEAEIQAVSKIDDIELLVKDSKLFVTLSEFKDVIPTNLESCENSNSASNDVSILNVDVDVDAIPGEFVEAGFAALRQKISEQASDETSLSAANLNLLLKQYSSIIDSLKNIKIDLLVDAESNFVIKTSIAWKPESEIAKQLKASHETKTRWSSLISSGNAIFAAVSSGKTSDLFKEYQLDQFNNVAYPNILEQLEVLIDDPEDYEFAKQLAELLKSEEIASIEAGMFDSGIALGTDPLLLKVGTSVSAPEAVKEALKLTAERVRKDFADLDKYLVIDAEEINGFSISKLNLPIAVVCDEPANYFTGKALTVSIGIDDKSFALVAGLEPNQVDVEFAKLLLDAQELKATPKQQFFDLAPLAKITLEVLSSIDELEPVTRQSLEKVAGAQNVKLITEEDFIDNTLTVNFTLQSGIFKTAGELIRLGLRGPLSEDNSSDLDDVFDEE